MQKESIATGKSVEEAIATAKAQLGVTTEDTGFEILELPKRGFLGFGRCPAKVRVYLEEPEPPKPAPKPKPAPRPPKPAQPPKPQPEKPERAEKPAEPKPPRRTRPEPPPAPAAERPAPPPKPVQPPKAEQPYSMPADLSEKVQVAAGYAASVLSAMGVENFEIKARESEDHIELLLEGADLGVVIGRRGETLDALQYLTSLVANRIDGNYIRISIDSGDYRKKRAETLERLAYKLARSAVRTGRSTRLEPMNPYERRIIHAAVARVEGATSASTGEEPNRRVVISPKNSRRKPEEGAPRRGDRPERAERPDRDRGPDRGGRRRSGPRPPRPASRPADPAQRVNDAEIEIPADLAPKEIRPPEPAVKAAPEVRTPTEEEKSALPLYGKMDV